MNFKIQTIANQIDAVLFGNSNFKINSISIDSRSLENGTNTLFFAIIGSNHNAHLYIDDLIKRGVQCFVVSDIPKDLSTKATFLLVKNSTTALQSWAKYYRSLFQFPVIGVTGSNGKTIVKEWLNFLLSPDYTIICNPKSYNSQIGVPLSVLGCNKHHNFGVFEAGISTTNEMLHLEKIIKPSIGILTNIGSAHDEGFENKEQKIKEKLLLFKNVKVLICEKNKIIETFFSENTTLFCWSFEKNKAPVFIEKENNKSGTNLKITYKNKNFNVQIPFQENASIENAINCLMVFLYMDYAPEIIAHRFELLYPIEMRLKIKNGINNCCLIDDSYSSDFQSFKIALNFLENQKQYTQKTVILSDILQSGLPNEILYQKVSQLIVSNKVNQFIGVGKTICNFKFLFANGVFFETTTDFLKSSTISKFKNETILIKGARAFQFEKIVHFLTEKTHETTLEINLNALTHNLNFFKSKLHPKTKIMVMVKAFGYGNGGFEIAKLLEHLKVDYLGVAFADEGIELKNAGIKMPIMVLNPETTSFEALIKNGLEPEIYSLKGLKSFLKIASEKKLHLFPIHIKLDTGMNRLGFVAEDIDELIHVLKNNNTVQVRSILSHLSASDNSNFKDFTLHQISLFDTISLKLINELKCNPIRHILNTGGISNFTNAQFDMVRLGIGLYGISSNEKEQKMLENVSTLKSVISQIKHIKKGESIGYNRKFIAKQNMRSATIPIGYADGISRHWGNEKGFVIINNQKAFIIGSICMDMLMVDCSEIACNEGDPVIIFGESPTVNEIAKELDTIPYEILTSISQRVKRVFYRE